ncbi:Type I restriction-modification system, specificity subunit S [Vibrio chagasii]|nr:Type I restriction-modification system, specificity subunit S [Vibrio chagasii]CAH6901935.1 Type I restriction-modification system, specificity subunit S [Vibrio chagasii]CAH6909442.1 Type I restriction-modification system, specificity subunit S [Vibrio chagasii]CAH7182609.1 Type I restriction-modification system, specificity subunit S [Vibrio chagasii]CAH7195052.1 Type I restriction-modification system, specificity subunit S [Vibrio chagasii]
MMSLDQTPINQLITDNIDTWTSTVKTKATTGRGSSKKLELYGVKKLRELILELAVRGKLVPQDPSDEPASVLLERIVEIKAQLVKEKKIKPPKKSVEISDGEKPFDIPKNWKWIRLSDYAQIFSGNAFTSGDFSSEAGTKAIKITNAGVGHLIETDEYLPEEFLTTYSQYRVVKNDLILALTRPYISDGLKVSMCPDSYHNSLLNQRVAAIRSYVNPEYAFFMLSSPYVLNTYKNRFSGSGLQPNLKMSDVTELVIPLCSEEEQHRIVAKVDELMTLCDQLEQQTEASIAAHQILVTTLLDTLTNSSDADELMQNWQMVTEHFDTLFTTEASIDQLKQTILQLAVMGKLVPQDANDEPAAKLLERIAEEKAQLIKDKKIKKHPSVEPIGDVGVIPSSWKEIVVQDFADIRLGSTPSRHESKFWNGDIPWVSSGEVANGVIVDTAEKITQAGFDNSSTSIIPKRSLLMAIIGQGKTRGQTALLGIDACTNQNVAAFVFNEEFVIPEYVWLWAQSKYESHRQGGHGGAQPALNGKKVRSFAFPLPPTNEQMRIVEKVNELNLLCEQLKQRLRDSQQTQLQLTDVIVEQVL